MSISTNATATTRRRRSRRRWQALTRAVESGKARYIGFSEWPADKIQAAIDMTGVARFVSSQPQYSLLWRAPEKEVIPLCAANGISQIVWSPLAQGRADRQIRARRAAAGGQPRDQRGDGRLDRHLAAARRCSKRSQRLKPLAAEAGLSLAQFALAWVLREPNVASAIIGASRPSQVDDNAAASDATVDPALFAEAERIVAAALILARVELVRAALAEQEAALHPRPDRVVISEQEGVVVAAVVGDGRSCGGSSRRRWRSPRRGRRAAPARASAARRRRRRRAARR